MLDLHGKKILLIAPNNFSYGHLIKNKLVQLGAVVVLWNDRSQNSSFGKAVLRVFPEVLRIDAIKTFAQKGEIDHVVDFDAVLCVIGEAVFPETLDALRIANPNAKFIWYMWDSFENKPHLRRNHGLFDSSFTFDTEDAKRYEMGFRPLFFVEDVISELELPPAYDLSFVGTVHADRISVVSRVFDEVERLGGETFSYFFSPSRVIGAWHQLKANASASARKCTVRYDALSRELFLKSLWHSKAVIDVQHPSQSGLTMRSLEVTGAGRKLVTTNSAITEYDLYDPTRIAVIDRSKPIFDKRFFDVPALPLDPALRHKYSLTGWITDVFEICNFKTVGSEPSRPH
jgi:hypothetical protein